jgi:hypothetical protein
MIFRDAVIFRSLLRLSITTKRLQLPITTVNDRSQSRRSTILLYCLKIACPWTRRDRVRNGDAPLFLQRLHGNPSREEREQSRTKLDFDLTTQKLTWLAGTFAFCDLTFDIGLHSLIQVEKMSQDFYEGSGGQELSAPLAQRIQYLKGLILGAQSRKTHLE